MSPNPENTLVEILPFTQAPVLAVDGSCPLLLFRPAHNHKNAMLPASSKTDWSKTDWKPTETDWDRHFQNGLGQAL